jgi:hypothetical protein
MTYASHARAKGVLLPDSAAKVTILTPNRDGALRGEGGYVAAEIVEEEISYEPT